MWLLDRHKAACVHEVMARNTNQTRGSFPLGPYVLVEGNVTGVSHFPEKPVWCSVLDTTTMFTISGNVILFGIYSCMYACVYAWVYVRVCMGVCMLVCVIKKLILDLPHWWQKDKCFLLSVLVYCYVICFVTVFKKGYDILVLLRES